MTVLFLRRLPFALVPLNSLFLLFFGLRRQHELLRYLLLRDELRDGARLPEPAGGGGGAEGDMRQERGREETESVAD